MLVSKLFAGFAVTGLLGVTACLLSADAFAQHRGSSARGSSAGARPSTGARGPSSGVRSHAQGVRPHYGAARGYSGYSGYRGPRVVVGAPIIASPWWYYNDPNPYYYGYDPYYSPPVAYVEEQAPVYVEQQAPAPAAAPQQYWYYCADSKTYFPYVQTCVSPWQRVVPYAPQ